MNMKFQTNNPVKRAFTLIEILIVVVILGILAAIVVPQFTDAADDANEAAVRSQLQTLRGQIELYRAQLGTDPPSLAADGDWDSLVDNDYLMRNPQNPWQSSSTVAGAAAVDTGWVWRDKGNGTFAIYAVDSTGIEFDED